MRLNLASMLGSYQYIIKLPTTCTNEEAPGIARGGGDYSKLAWDRAFFNVVEYT